MTAGTIESIDFKRKQGHIKPNHGGDHIPFDFDGLAEGEDAQQLQEGDRVYFEVEGGLAGIMAVRVRRVADNAPPGLPKEE